jgi:hypothetical protein
MPRSSWLALKLSQSLNILYFQDLFGVTFQHAIDHRLPDFTQGHDLTRHQQPKHRIQDRAEHFE